MRGTQLPWAPELTGRVRNSPVSAPALAQSASGRGRNLAKGIAEVCCTITLLLLSLCVVCCMWGAALHVRRSAGPPQYAGSDAASVLLQALICKCWSRCSSCQTPFDGPPSAHSKKQRRGHNESKQPLSTIQTCINAFEQGKLPMLRQRGLETFGRESAQSES